MKSILVSCYITVHIGIYDVQVFWMFCKINSFLIISLFSKQERLDFLYESGLAVGKGSSDGFKALESLPSNDVASSSAAKVLWSSAIYPIFFC